MNDLIYDTNGLQVYVSTISLEDSTDTYIKITVVKDKKETIIYEYNPYENSSSFNKQ